MSSGFDKVSFETNSYACCVETKLGVAMIDRTGSPREDWCRPTVFLFETASPVDFVFDPGAPNDGRNLPDVDLDSLAEAVLSRLAPRPAAGQGTG